MTVKKRQAANRLFLREQLDELAVMGQTPLADMDVNTLEALRDKLDLLEKVGRVKAKLMQRLWNAEKADLVEGLQAQTSIPIEATPIYRAQPTEGLSSTQNSRTL